MRENVGGPRLETDQPGLLEAIIDLVQNSTGADDKRRSEILRTTRTLVELHPALLELGYILCKIRRRAGGRPFTHCVKICFFLSRECFP